MRTQQCDQERLSSNQLCTLSNIGKGTNLYSLEQSRRCVGVGSGKPRNVKKETAFLHFFTQRDLTIIYIKQNEM